MHGFVGCLALIAACGTLGIAAFSVCRELRAEAETQLSLTSASLLRAIGRDLQNRGFDCPNLRGLLLLKARQDGNVIQVTCGGIAAPELAQIRLVVRGSGSFAAEPWSEAPYLLKGSS